jgi:hypothetical protein
MRFLVKMGYIAPKSTTFATTKCRRFWGFFVVDDMHNWVAGTVTEGAVEPESEVLEDDASRKWSTFDSPCNRAAGLCDTR